MYTCDLLSISMCMYHFVAMGNVQCDVPIGSSNVNLNIITHCCAGIHRSDTLLRVPFGGERISHLSYTVG